MPKRISKDERATIHYLSRIGWSQYKIAKLLKIRRESVRRWSKMNKNGDLSDLSRKTSKLTPRTQRLIQRNLYENGSTRKTAKIFNISNSYVHKLCRGRNNSNNDNKLYPYKAQKTLRIIDTHRQKRLAWINTYHATLANYKIMVHADEKPFELEHTPNKQNTRYWRHNATEKLNERLFAQDKFPTTIHMFTAISWWFKFPLRFYIETEVTSKGDFFCCCVHLCC